MKSLARKFWRNHLIYGLFHRFCPLKSFFPALFRPFLGHQRPRCNGMWLHRSHKGLAEAEAEQQNAEDAHRAESIGFVATRRGVQYAQK
eukprot:scaffold434_cov186-Pinguiococcus_pyrenoidosus.AAC.20